MPTDASNPGEIIPRNTVWVEDMPPDFGKLDIELLTESYFTHAIICFFHLDQNLTLTYNGKDPNGADFQSWWPYLRGLAQIRLAKTVMLSVGGWQSGTWENAEGREAEAAAIIVQFARENGFSGIDFNFEGNEGAYARIRDRLLTAFAKMVVEVRKTWNGSFTITPINGLILEQLQHIQTAVGHPFPWGDYLSWINVQFYSYYNGAPRPNDNVAGRYESVLSTYGLSPNLVAVGFPLSETDLQFNQGELLTATGAVKDIFTTHPDFAGMFVWRFRGAFLSNNVNPLLWASHFSKILRNR